MNGFRRKLRQFRKDWVRKSRRLSSPAAPAPPATASPLPARSLLGFFLDAEDGLRGVRAAYAWSLPQSAAAAVRRSFPRFRDAVANDGEPRAA